MLELLWGHCKEKKKKITGHGSEKGVQEARG